MNTSNIPEPLSSSSPPISRRNVIRRKRNLLPYFLYKGFLKKIHLNLTPNSVYVKPAEPAVATAEAILLCNP